MNLESIKDANIPAGDIKAKSELEGIIQDNLNQQNLKNHMHKAFIGLLWAAFIAFIVVFLIRIFHLVAPSGLCWLTGDSLQGIDKLIFSGTIGGFIGRYFKRVEKQN